MKQINSRNVGMLICVLIFSLMLLAGSIFGSDFPRFLYCCPQQIYNPWDSLQAIDASLICNYRSAWSSLPAYLDSLYAHDLKSVLRNSGEQPYRVEYYSQAQYMRYEVDKDYSEQTYDWEHGGTGYYFFQHNQGQDSLNFPSLNNGTSWHLDTAINTSGLAFYGPKYTGDQNAGGLEQEWRPGQTQIYDNLSYKIYRHRISIAADLGSLDSATWVFTLVIDHKFNNSYVQAAKTISKTVGGFGGSSMTFKEFWVADTLVSVDTLKYVKYSFVWSGNCDIWVDWIETMDCPRGYDLSWTTGMRDSTLHAISAECSTMENTYNASVIKIADWAQIDTPGRINFSALGYINNRFRSDDLKPAISAFNRTTYQGNQHRRHDHFLSVAKPQIHEMYDYWFGTDQVVGAQSELDSIARDLELGYQACGDSLSFRYLCQGHSHQGEGLRDPLPSELKVQAYLALAHGAQGVGYYGYISLWDSSGQTQIGLVDSNFHHDTSPYQEKWAAVQEVFTQIDSMGNTLSALQRDAAYCCTNPNYQSPVTGISFSETGTPYIEVGQFHDSTDADYLIIVNRRTDADRHITVEINYAGIWALRDLYTQERFFTTTGKFKSIPFAAGEGRVFKLENISISVNN